MRRRWGMLAALATLLTLVLLAAVVAPGLLGPREPTREDSWQGAPAAPGSAPPPTTETPVPEGALVVARDGDDSAPGTARAPLRSIAAALARASRGDTVVVREGVWHESVHLASAVTLRSWPGEHVWLDGSLPLPPEAFTRVPGDGAAVWRLDGYPIRLDTSPTFTRGAPDNTEPGWRFVDPEYPLAADPQQIWHGATPLAPVGDPGEVGPGTFHIDVAAQALFVGADPSEGRPLSAGAITKALLITAPGARVEGIGIRRYVPSVPDFGAVTVDGPGALLRDVLVTQSSTIGVSVQTRDVTLERVRVREAGMLGLHGHRADGLRLLDTHADGNNTRRFNIAPVAGGAKITTSRGITVEGGSYSGNRGNGLWLDESVVDSRVVGVDVSDNLVHGLQIELCAGVDVEKAVAARNGGIGISVQNSDHVRIKDVTAVANGRQIAFVQDGRRPTDPEAGSRLLTGVNGTPTWTIGDSQVVGSLLANTDGAGTFSDGDALFAVEDYTKTLDANALGIRLRHNLYVRDRRAGRQWTHVWSRPGEHPAVFSSVDAFRAATGQDDGSRESTSLAPTSEFPRPAT